MIVKDYKKGTLLIQTIVFGSIAVVIIGGLISWANVNIKASRLSLVREQAVQIAEAGIDYYRWHLAHAATDYQDGTGSPGPYVHDFYDKDGVKLGTFTLNITPPVVGSTLVTVQSDGRSEQNSSIVRKLRVVLGIPSLAKFAAVSNDNIRFGQGTEVFGPIHSNGGIRFDGISHNIITSSRTDYDDPDHTGNNEFGVHTHVNAPPGTGVNNAFRAQEAPPTSPVPNRTDVFMAGRLFPVPVVDFVGMTTDLSQIKTDAQASGRYISSSGVQGYRIVLKTDDTFDVYRVNNLTSPPGGCTNSQSQSGWGTWSIRTTAGSQTFVANYPIPANGLIFVEDNIWVEGQINTARVTIAAGRFPDNAATRPSITVNNNLLYTNFNGSDVVALISQNNINTGLSSADTLTVDAALVAQNGRVGRYYYSSSCGTGYTRNTINLYGMIASNIRYGFAYTDGTGYTNRNLNYDANLLYGPPPSFPLTSDQYTIISWQEVQ